MKRAGVWKIRKELFILYYAFKDGRTPLYSKLPAIGAIIYLISPIDIIPDFIPFVGYLDDLVIVPVLLNASIRLLSPDVYETSMIKANRSHLKLNILMILFLLLIVGIMVYVFLSIARFFH